MPHDKDDEEIVEWAGSPDISVSHPRKSFWTWEGFFSHCYDPTIHMAVVVIEVLLLESIDPWRIKMGVAVSVLVLAWILLVWLNIKREALVG